MALWAWARLMFCPSPANNVCGTCGLLQPRAAPLPVAAVVRLSRAHLWWWWWYREDAR